MPPKMQTIEQVKAKLTRIHQGGWTLYIVLGKVGEAIVFPGVNIGGKIRLPLFGSMDVATEFRDQYLSGCVVADAPVPLLIESLDKIAPDGVVFADDTGELAKA
jgi:hypothetical protein